jgi:hypothetical protein
MRSAGLALGWELWAKNRLGLSAVALYAAATAVLVRVLPETMAGELIAKPALLLSIFIYLYLLWIFVYAENTLAGNDTGFPPRLFTHPVRSSVLVAWPMLYGMATIALMMFWLQWIVYPPIAGDFFRWWILAPMLFLAATLAAFQAICWTIVRFPLLRIAIAVFGLPFFVMSETFPRVYPGLPPTSFDISLHACEIIFVAYVAAVVGVGYDRRGGRFHLGILWETVAPRWARVLGNGQPFPSSRAAQRWLEVRRHAWLVWLLGVSLFVGGYLAATLRVPSVDDPYAINAIVLAPVFLSLIALFPGFGMGKTSFWARDLRLSSFIATRPVSSYALARAKFDAVAYYSVRVWLYVLLLTVVMVVAFDKTRTVMRMISVLFPHQPAWKFGVMAPVAVAGFVGLVWFQFVAGTCLSVSGREWLLNGAVLLSVAAGVALASVARWLGDFVVGQPGISLNDSVPFNSVIAALWSVGVALMLVKLTTLVAVLWLCWHGRTGVVVLAWLATAACLLIPLYALVPAGIPHSLVALYVILALPINRPLLLPAAIEWNRHR